MQRVSSAFLTKSAIYGEKIALLGPKTKIWDHHVPYNLSL